MESVPDPLWSWAVSYIFCLALDGELRTAGLNTNNQTQGQIELGYGPAVE